MRYTANFIGKQRRLKNILGDENKCIIVPLDDNLISGPQTTIDTIIKKIHQIESANPNAILAFPGTLACIENSSIPKILNLTASTIRSHHTKKVLTFSLEYALKMAVDAIAVHINITSNYEAEMLETFGKVSEVCDTYGMPLLAIIYPRGENELGDQNYTDLKDCDNEKYTELVSHCVRIAFEMGADIIKTQYTGTVNSFKSVVQSASGRPVVIAGGGMMEPRALFQMIAGAMDAGAAGVSIGRNVFGRIDSEKMISCIHDIVIEGRSAEQAMKKWEEAHEYLE